MVNTLTIACEKTKRGQSQFSEDDEREQDFFERRTETMAFRMEAMPLKTAMMPRPMAETMLASCRGGKKSFKSREGKIRWSALRDALWL